MFYKKEKAFNKLDLMEKHRRVLLTAFSLFTAFFFR